MTIADEQTVPTQLADASTPRRALALQRFLRDRLALAGLVILAITVALSAAAPLVASHDPLEINVLDKNQGPSWDYLMGTDNIGRSIWARVVYGGRLTLGGAFLAMLCIVVIGVVVGMIAGYSGGLMDSVLMRVVDLVLAFPSLALALVIAGVLGPGFVNVLIAIIITGWATYARLTRGMVLSMREEEFVEAALALGVRPWRIMFRHILPNILSPLIVLVSLNMGGMLLYISILSFLGLGVQAPTPEWGRMLDDARPFMQSAPHSMFFPGFAIFLTVMAFNLLGDGLGDALDPRRVIKR